MKVRKIPGTKSRGVFGNAIIHGPIDNSFTIIIDSFIKQGGEYRMSPYKISQKNACDAANNDKLFLPELAKVSNITLPMPCPCFNVLFCSILTLLN